MILGHNKPRTHVAELNGGSTRFQSYNTGFWLESDAIQACKNAGLYRSADDASRIRIDGIPVRWHIT